MKKNMIIFLSTMIVYCITMVSCQSPESNQLSNDDLTAIKKAIESYGQAGEANDWSMWSDLFAEDATLMPPGGQPVQGRTAIQSWSESIRATWSDMTLSPLEIDGEGGLAVSRGSYSSTFQSEGAPAEVTHNGKWIYVWKKQFDGSWKLWWATWNNTRPRAAKMPESN